MAGSAAAQYQQQQSKAQNPSEELDTFMAGIWQDNTEWSWDFPTGLECAQSPADETSQANTVAKNSPTNEWSEPEPGALTFEEPILFDNDEVENDAFFTELTTGCNSQADLDPAVVPPVQQPQQHQYIAPVYEHPAPMVEQQQPMMALAINEKHPTSHDNFVFPRATSAAPKPCPRRAPKHKSESPTESSSDDAPSDAKLCKWKRRDIAKHLAGERSRRAKRMGKVHALQALVDGLSSKPTVNQILSAAIEKIKAAKAEAASSSSTVSNNRKLATSPKSSDNSFVSMRDAMRCSSSLPCMVLDDNHCVLEASPAMLKELKWPGDEESIKGQYIASVMHPEDACTLVNEASAFRSVNRAASTIQVVKMALSLMEFTPMVGLAGCCAFPKGYKAQCVVDCTINNKTMFISVV